MPALAREELDSPPPLRRIGPCRLESLAVDDFPLRSEYDQITRLGVVLVCGEAISAHRRIVAREFGGVYSVPTIPRYCIESVSTWKAGSRGG